MFDTPIEAILYFKEDIKKPNGQIQISNQVPKNKKEDSPQRTEEFKCEGKRLPLPLRERGGVRGNKDGKPFLPIVITPTLTLPPQETVS